MRRKARPVAGNREGLADDHGAGLDLRTQDIVYIALEAWPADLARNYLVWPDHAQWVLDLGGTTTHGNLDCRRNGIYAQLGATGHVDRRGATVEDARPSSQ